MSANHHDPSAGQPRNNGKYGFRTNTAPDLALAGPPATPEDRTPDLMDIADKLEGHGLSPEAARSFVGLRLVAEVGKMHGEAGRQYLASGHDVPAAEYAISMQTLLGLGRDLDKSATMEERRAAVESARARLRSVGGMLEMAKGRPVTAFEEARGVMGDLEPLYADLPEMSSSLVETNRERRGHDFYGPEFTQAPDLYGSDGVPSEEKTVYARYFHGQSEWFVFETNKNTGEMYGFVVLNGDTQMSEHGYTDLTELEGIVDKSGAVVERDLQWTPRKFADVDPRR